MQKKGFPIWICFAAAIVLCLAAMIAVAGMGGVLLEGLLALLGILLGLGAYMGNAHLFARRVRTVRDAVLLPLITLCLVASLLLSLLDQYHWLLVPMPRMLMLLGVALLVGCYFVLFYLFPARPAHVQSCYGEPVQEDKERWGLYRLVRHPYALAVIVAFLAMPLLGGSWLGYTAGAVGIVLLIVRTNLEDSARYMDLEWYVQYTQEVKSCLIPFVW